MMSLLVLLVEIGEINNKIFDDQHVRQRSYYSWLASVAIDWLKACHSVGAINVNVTRPTNPFSA